MKKAKCPYCGDEYLSDFWKPERKLQQQCKECGWKGEIRTPEKKEIVPSKNVQVNNFYGFCFHIFDKYGYIMTSSRSYDTKEEAKEELLKGLAKGKKDIPGGPYTGILWPDIVKVKGTVYK